jgi:hypothetical protein
MKVYWENIIIVAFLLISMIIVGCNNDSVTSETKEVKEKIKKQKEEKAQKQLVIEKELRNPIKNVEIFGKSLGKIGDIYYVEKIADGDYLVFAKVPEHYDSISRNETFYYRVLIKDKDRKPELDESVKGKNTSKVVSMINDNKLKIKLKADLEEARERERQRQLQENQQATQRMINNSVRRPY